MRTITIPRELFIALYDDAYDLLAEWHWKKHEERKGYRDRYLDLEKRIKKAEKYLEDTALDG